MLPKFAETSYNTGQIGRAIMPIKRFTTLKDLKAVLTSSVNSTVVRELSKGCGNITFIEGENTH